MPSDIEYVVERSKRLEGRLRRELNATGAGLRNLADSVQEALPPRTYQQLRKAAEIRNEILHDEKRNRLENRPEFAHLCDSIEESLDKLNEPEQSQGLSWGCLMVLCIFGLLVYLLSQHPS